MSRVWADEIRCPNCAQVPKPNVNGILSCGCEGKSWAREPSIAGTEEECALLESNGFSEEQDIRGNVYYVGPLGHIVELFADGTWRSDKAAKGGTMETYLRSIPQQDAF
jgi:hypothetical protein